MSFVYIIIFITHDSNHDMIILAPKEFMYSATEIKVAVNMGLNVFDYGASSGYEEIIEALELSVGANTTDLLQCIDRYRIRDGVYKDTASVMVYAPTHLCRHHHGC